jgi:lipoprotein-anchoring transpeptidase ErfK/SrfK
MLVVLLVAGCTSSLRIHYAPAVSRTFAPTTAHTIEIYQPPGPDRLYDIIGVIELDAARGQLPENLTLLLKEAAAPHGAEALMVAEPLDATKPGYLFGTFSVPQHRSVIKAVAVRFVPAHAVQPRPPVVEISPPEPVKIDRILVEKKSRRLHLLSEGKIVKSYSIALGWNPEGPKVREGDGRTPEGCYVIDGRNSDSHYHRALHISYPNADDEERAATMGTSPGGGIYIHGLPKGCGWLGSLHQEMYWTDGCIAVTNTEVEEIWNTVPDGTPIEIRP